MTWELDFMRWANGWWSSSLLDHMVPWLTYLGSHFAVILFILVSLLSTHKRRPLRHLLLLYGIECGVIYGLKFMVQRPRPLFLLDMGAKLSKGPGEILDPSFPSAHAALSFMMATVLAHRYPRVRLIFFLCAGLIGWTRIYLGLHFPSDVVVGALLGYGITKGYQRVFGLIETGESRSKRGD